MTKNLVQSTLIIGSGAAACHAAKELLSAGIEVVLVERSASPILSTGISGHSGLKVLPGTEVVSCRGAVGKFEIVLKSSGAAITANFGAVIIAEQAGKHPNFSQYGLSPSGMVVSISELEEALNELGKKRLEEVAFLAGIKGPIHTSAMKRIMQEANNLLRSGHSAKVYIITRDVKTAGSGLELLYKESRQAGVIFFRLTHTEAEIRQGKNGPVTIKLRDEIASECHELSPEMTVVDETIFPSGYHNRLAEIFGLDTNEEGFLQTKNVHRLPVFTNRQGVLVVGPSRSVGDPDEELRDAENAVSEIVKYLKRGFLPLEKATVTRGKCTMCLTCYRVCPHHAITWDNRAVIMPEACQACGICAAECPMDAIRIEGISRDRGRVETISGLDCHIQKEPWVPVIKAFCCQRSAQRAFELASRHGPFSLGFQVTEVSCAGSIGIGDIINSLAKGADGAMILACHKGNCHAERGNIYAENRIENARVLLKEIGLEQNRLIFRTLSSNMGTEFREIVQDALEELKILGPNPLNRIAERESFSK